MAWAQTGHLDAPLLVLVVAALISNQAALHLSDDYFDYLEGVDSPDPERRNLYAGGSKVLPRGELTTVASSGWGSSTPTCTRRTCSC